LNKINNFSLFPIRPRLTVPLEGRYVDFLKSEVHRKVNLTGTSDIRYGNLGNNS